MKHIKTINEWYQPYDTYRTSNTPTLSIHDVKVGDKVNVAGGENIVVDEIVSWVKNKSGSITEFVGKTEDDPTTKIHFVYDDSIDGYKRKEGQNIPPSHMPRTDKDFRNII